jgi:hypothetical protein
VDRTVPVRTVVLLVGSALLAGAVGGYGVAGAGSDGGLSDPPPLDDPQVERFERTDAGCRSTITPSGGTTVGPGGRFAASGVMDTDSPDSNLAMEITRTSPDGARITTYRVDLSSYAREENATDTEDCAGEVAYRLNLTVDYRETMRVAVYEKGEVVSCGGTDCSPVMADKRPRWWANGTA